MRVSTELPGSFGTSIRELEHAEYLPFSIPIFLRHKKIPALNHGVPVMLKRLEDGKHDAEQASKDITLTPLLNSFTNHLVGRNCPSSPSSNRGVLRTSSPLFCVKNICGGRSGPLASVRRGGRYRPSSPDNRCCCGLKNEVTVL